MKILFICRYSPETIKSYNNYITKICNYLSNDRMNDVILVTPNGLKKIDGKFRHISIGISFHNLPILKTFFGNLSVFWGAINIAKNHSPDLIFCHGGGLLYSTFFTGIVLSKLNNIPFISQWVGFDLLLNTNYHGKKLKRMILKESNMNIVPSKAMKNKALSLKISSIKIIPTDGVDIEKFKPDLCKKSKNLEREHLLFVGRLHKVKGLEYLIKSFSTVNKKYKNSVLDIVGDGEIKGELIELAEKEGVKNNVNFVGEVPHSEIVEYYQKSDIFILPSLSEGLSMVTLEAMACGLPVIATKCGGPEEFVKDGKGGYLIPAKNSYQLTKVIIKLIENPKLRKRMGIFNRKYVKKYSHSVIKNKYLKTIDTIVHDEIKR